jgi:hypothetical protein
MVSAPVLLLPRHNTRSVTGVSPGQITIFILKKKNASWLAPCAEKRDGRSTRD